ncbi:MAG: hypothetical protein ACTSRU_20715 [Candidatus Hodarchaeales archaeon]
MADEIEQTTVAADGVSMVDNLPGVSSTGYQIQNTLSATIRNGIDSIVIEEGDGTVEVKISGPLDENGLLFNVKTAFSISVSGSTTKYLVLKDGTSTTQKTIATTEEVPVFVPEKNGWYTAANERVLNTCVVGETLVGFHPFNKSSQSFLNPTWHYMEAARWRDVRYEALRSAPSAIVEVLPDFPGFESRSILSDAGIYSNISYAVIPGLINIAGDGFDERNCIFVNYYLGILELEVLFVPLEHDVRGVSMYAGDLFVLYSRIVNTIAETVIVKHVGLSITVDSEVILSDIDTTGIDFDANGNLFSCSTSSDEVSIHDGFSNVILDTISVPNPADICVVNSWIIVSSTLSVPYSGGTYYVIDIETKEKMTQYGRSLDDYSWGITVTKSTVESLANEGLDCIVTANETGVSLRY